MICKKCGHEIAVGAKFCQQCGEQCAPPVMARAVTGPAKECPACHAKVEIAKSICPNCGRRFDIEELRKASAGTPQDKAAGVGCLLVIAAAIVWGLYSCASESPEDAAAQEGEDRAAASKQAEAKLNGFHCLSGWDGSNASLVRQVKAQLREPSSFEHDETRITPRDVKGDHMVTMRYRARNGFGGVNVSSALAVVNGSSCEATVVSSGE